MTSVSIFATFLPPSPSKPWQQRYHSTGGRHPVVVAISSISSFPAGSRRNTLATFIFANVCGVVSGTVGFSSAALAANDAILIALRDKSKSDEVESGKIAIRLQQALAELGRANTLASTGDYDAARQIIRKGSCASLRLDVDKVAKYVALQRPTFDRFEGLELIGALDAFDASMRGVLTGVPNVTPRDVAANGAASIKALEEILALLNRTSRD